MEEKAFKSPWLWRGQNLEVTRSKKEGCINIDGWALARADVKGLAEWP